MLRIVSIAFIFSALMLGCMPTPMSDDNGHGSWAQQVLPELLGRKIRGWEETDVLGQASALLGRPVVSRAIMLDPGFVTHWSETLMDHLQVQRDGAKGVRDADRTCWGSPLALAEGEGDGGELARWIGRHRPDGGFIPIADPFRVGGGPLDDGAPGSRPEGRWNMVDVIRSAIELDDLGPVYAANLIPLQMQTGLTNVDQAQGRARARKRLGGEFDQVYFGRDQSCMQCHTELGSASDREDWHRTFEHFPTVEPKVFDEPLGSEQTIGAAHAPFDPAIRGGDFYPWEIDDSCVRGRNDGDSIEGLHPRIPNPDELEGKLGSISGMGKSILDVERALHNGINRLSGRRLNSYLNGGERIDFSADEAMAYMLAMNISNNVWEQIMGERLTLPHGYPRNPEQRDLLRFLTEDRLLSDGWSLRSVLEHILSSTWFNHRAPYAASRNFRTPYHLPMVLDPWLAVSPGEPSDDPKTRFNGQGRVVHRFAPRVLVRSLGTALGHASLPPHFDLELDDDYAFAQAMGQYLNDFMPGTRSTDFLAMMTWFDRHGSCPDPSEDDGHEDWIDRVQIAALNWDAENPDEPPLLLRDVVLTLKDWLVGEATLDADLPEGSETAAVEALLGGLDLDTRIADIPPDNLERGARKYCGILVSSPQFMLAGIRPANLGQGSRLRVCNPGEPCSWIQTCEAWIGHLEEASGKDLTCVRNGNQLIESIDHLTDQPWLDRPELAPPGLPDTEFTETEPLPIDPSPVPEPGPSPLPGTDSGSSSEASFTI